MSSDTVDELAAEIALAGLYAGLSHPDDVVVPGVLLLPQGVPVSRSGAVKDLVARRKPLMCVGFTVLGCFAVAAWEVDQAAAENHKALVQGDLDWIENQFGPAADSVVLVRSAAAALSVPMIALRRWYHDYQSPFVDRAIERADASLSSQGFRAVLSFQRPVSGIRVRRTG